MPRRERAIDDGVEVDRGRDDRGGIAWCLDQQVLVMIVKE
jgi:hypothetical protein